MKFTKKAVAILTALTLTLAPMAVSASIDEISVTINGVPLEFADQQPVIVDSRTLVPVGGVFGALGFTPSWDNYAQTATLTRSDYVIIITIGSTVFTTNGTEHTLDVPAQIINDRTMLPIRAVLESVGYELDWENETRTVLIETPGHAPQDDACEETAPPEDDEPPAQGSDFLNHFDLGVVQEILQQYLSTEAPEGHVVFEQHWLMDEYSFDFGDGRVIRWQFLHTDGLAFWEIEDVMDSGNILGSVTGQALLMLNQDGQTFINIDLGGVFEIFGAEGHPDWMTEYHRAYYVIELN